MKQELKRLIAKEITKYEEEYMVYKSCIKNFEVGANIDSDSRTSQLSFQYLNMYKNKIRRVSTKLKKLREMQCQLKQIVSFVTTKSEVIFEITNMIHLT